MDASLKGYDFDRTSAGFVLFVPGMNVVDEVLPKCIGGSMSLYLVPGLIDDLDLALAVQDQ